MGRIGRPIEKPWHRTNERLPIFRCLDVQLGGEVRSGDTEEGTAPPCLCGPRASCCFFDAESRLPRTRVREEMLFGSKHRSQGTHISRSRPPPTPGSPCTQEAQTQLQIHPPCTSIQKCHHGVSGIRICCDCIRGKEASRAKGQAQDEFACAQIPRCDSPGRRHDRPLGARSKGWLYTGATLLLR